MSRSTSNRCAGQMPQHDLDAERAVISAALLDAGAADVVVAMLEASAFFSPPHQRVFSTLAMLVEQGRAVDVVSVASQLRADDVLGEVGGASYLGQLVDATPAVAHVDEHCRIVADLARQRRLTEQCHTIAAEGYQSQDDVPSWLGTVERRILSATTAGHQQDIVPLRDILAGVSEDHSRDPNEAASDRIASGYTDLDIDSGGLYGGDLVVIAARPGMGKSALVQGIARNVATTGRHVALFSVEMPRKQVAHRLLAQAAGVRLNAVRDPQNNATTADEHYRMTGAMDELSKLPIHIDATPGLMMPELRSKARRIASKARALGSPLGMVVLDYLQRMGRDKSSQSREQDVSANCAGLKDLAMDLGVPVVACAQLNRALESRTGGDKRPMLSDLRESGSIEQEADQVWFVYRDAYYSSSAEKRKAELIIGKNRNGGPTMTVDMGWDGWCTRFVDWRE